MTTRGLIMSCSLCSTMWQCHTCSCPPVRGLTAFRMSAFGKFGGLNCIMTVATSPGLICTVSFQPISLVHAGTPLKSMLTSARPAGASSRLSGPSGSAVFPLGPRTRSNGQGMPFGCTATRYYASIYRGNWYKLKKDIDNE